ncbi:hypothetical protein M408DRAFT_90900 [Serendipita vermifera MAFF 305830]|uniref:Calponin-homology (CH) domain-containing protein n=1 Tax=Serendipita vermifera MAFF 305830 TaxID=933852 RepID=A0A0C3BBD3_SERVB|nr:hypothetical protein M408DRAFT_90900 [Serendipita vermifera MAFF 305830]
MAAAGVPRKSLDVESSRSPSSAAQNAPTQKTLKRMFQDTLRVTGLSRQRARDEQLSPPPPSDKRKEKDKDKQKPPEETKRGFISTFTRKPKLSISGGTGTNNDGDERPFMGSLRHASMSSPVLPLFSNPIITHRDAPARQGSSTHATNNVSPVRPRASSRRSSTSRDREPSSAPLQISRPRALAPASPSSPTFPQNSSRATRGVSPPPQRNQSPTSRITRFPSISTSNLPSSSVQRTVSPTFYSRNTSTTSLIASSPFRETIRTASSLLIKHLSRPPPPLKAEDWHDVEVRLRALARLERIWGKSGGGGSSTTAVGTTASGFGGGEDRERRLFCETVRDGYVLCALLNKFRPGTIPRPDPKEDGFAKTSNVTKFLAGALHYGISNSDLFMRNDLLEASSESLGRVAQTIIAVVKLGEPSQPAIDGNRGPYMSVRDGSISSPNLLDSRSLSPSRPGHKKRYSPPSNLPPVPGSSSGKPAPTPIGTRQTRSTSMTGRPSDFPQEAMYHNSAFAPSAPPPRSPLRPTVSPRASVASGTTDSTTGFSLLDNRASARFATMRSGTTEATSIHPSETSSIIGARRDSKPGPELPVADQPPPSNQTQFTDLPSMNRRRSYDREASAAKLAAAQLDVSPTRVRRERRSSDLLSPDLSNVEEVDEMGTRRGRPFIDMPDWSLLNPTSASLPAAAAAAPAVSPLRRTSFDRPRVSFEEPADSVNPASGIDLTSTPPPKAKAGLPMRRPVHGHRHSVDTVSTTPALLPVPRHTSLNRERDGQPSPSSSRESSTPSPPTGASRPSLVPKRSTSRPSPRASYVPKLSGTDDPRRRHTGESSQIETSPSAPAAPRVPFPRSTSGDLGNAGTAGISRLAPLSTSSEVGTSGEAAAGDSAIGSSRNISPNGRAARPVLPRSRYNSELDTTRARKQRPNSLDDGDARPGRSRFESMMNLGTSVDALTRDSSMSVNAIRQPLIVREEGKPPMHYVSYIISDSSLIC